MRAPLRWLPREPDILSGRPGEFELITRYFKGLTTQADVELGVGDDAALLNISQLAEKHLVVASDALVAGVHFRPEADGRDIASRALCVNLSDMAAMGAVPRWFTLSLTLPAELANHDWLRRFSSGLAEVANRYDCALVGGDTTRGELNICITVIGEVESGAALRRTGARCGDQVYVTGTLGDGAAGLALLNAEFNAEGPARQRLLQRFYAPEPQLAAGRQLLGLASACIDISDGLVADLEHICNTGNLNAVIHAELLPVHPDLRELAAGLSRDWALSGGDDYQLCFCVPVNRKTQVDNLIKGGVLTATRIGEIVQRDDTWRDGRVRVLENGEPVNLQRSGYDHFGC